MADDKKNKEESDRKRGCGIEEQEIREFAESVGISVDEARRLVKELMAAVQAADNDATTIALNVAGQGSESHAA